MQIVYIHGASATPASFNYIRDRVGDGLMLAYDSQNGFKNNLELMQDKLANMHNIAFVAHSLGGIYALHLANLMPDRIKCAVSLSTPYGGHNMAEYAKLFLPFNNLLNDICPSSWPMRSLSEIEIRWPWSNVVTVRGHAPWVNEPNDGVVTIASQRHRSDMELIELDTNHYEVVLNPTAANIIADRLERLA